MNDGILGLRGGVIDGTFGSETQWKANLCVPIS